MKNYPKLTGTRFKAVQKHVEKRTPVSGQVIVQRLLLKLLDTFYFYNLHWFDLYSYTYSYIYIIDVYHPYLMLIYKT